ncbi:hypothetical protein BDR22DRAFT_855263 [Usnea florida]
MGWGSVCMLWVVLLVFVALEHSFLFLHRLLLPLLLLIHHLRMYAFASSASNDVLLSVIEDCLRVRIFFLGRGDLGDLYKH